MSLQSFGYMGIQTNKLDDWVDYGTKLLGLQIVERTKSGLTFRMDDRKQRLVVQHGDDGGPSVFGWEVVDANALNALAARLDATDVKLRHATSAQADQRRVKEMIIFNDPVGNQLEVFHGAEIASDPFRPGRNISGFRTGALGVGHAVLQVEKIEDVMPFYTDILGFKLSDFVLKPFKVYFFHINARHHSLALVEWGRNGIHHLMMELYNLDDVGQGYDIALREPERIAATLGRHINDLMTSFYTFSPSGFMVEHGWGGKSIDPVTWQPKQVMDGPSFWGHERTWLSSEGRAKALEMRLDAANRGIRQPVEVINGNYSIGPDICPWFVETKLAASQFGRNLP
jgi:2,3-dihydroxybiphenyl 1,2-dioxygenase